MQAAARIATQVEVVVDKLALVDLHTAAHVNLQQQQH
jgi:hypothetical protein